MTEFLGRIFIRDHNNVGSPAVRRAWGTLVSVIGIICNILLFVGKFTLGSLLGAVSLTADAVNNLSDAGSQLISLVSFRLSAKPADRKHPYGHARIEYLASMVVAFMVVIIGFDLFRESIGRIRSGEAAEASCLSVIVLAASMLVKLMLAGLNRSVGRRIDSSVMRATAADSLSDAAATCGVLAGQVVLLAWNFNIDAYIGCVVSLLIMWAGVQLLVEQKDRIIGEAPSTELVEQIRRTVMAHKDVLGVHDLMVHDYGPGRCIASLHAEVDGDADIYASHDMIDNIEKELGDTLGVSATIHLDPIVTDDAELTSAKDAVIAALERHGVGYCIHDFRMVRGGTHTNVIFDIVVPFEDRRDDAAIRAAVKAAVTETDKKYIAVITIDRG